MLRRILPCVLVSCGLVLSAPATGGAHNPGTDGGPISKGCKPIENRTIYVGATRISCTTARKIATGARRGKRYQNWSCGKAKGMTFGHCHGRGYARGAIVHWASND